MLDNRKGEFVRICYEGRGTLLGQSLVSFLELLINETRKKNDEAKEVEIYRNQGGVRAYQSLLGYFTKKLPEK